MIRFIRNIHRPANYHGHGIRKGPFFEGWYYKMVDASEHHRFAVIPGIFRGTTEQDDHAFIQVLDGITGKATYHPFPADAFHASETDFDIRLGDNHFRYDCLSLNIHDELRTVRAELSFSGGNPWPVTFTNPGVMGPFGWLPHMECYHGILSFNHAVTGTMTVDGDTMDFTGGRGYMEKDWGKAFPLGYVWMQTNHFETYGTSLECAVAVVPIGLGMSFRGTQLGFWHQNQLYPFATYTGARLTDLRITDHHVYITFMDKRYRIELTAERAEGTLLHAPVRTEMHKRVDETMKASVHVALYEQGIAKPIFSDTGQHAALEVHGDLERLLKG